MQDVAFTPLPQQPDFDVEAVTSGNDVTITVSGAKNVTLRMYNLAVKSRHGSVWQARLIDAKSPCVVVAFRDDSFADRRDVMCN